VSDPDPYFWRCHVNPDKQIDGAAGSLGTDLQGMPLVIDLVLD
jgi:hypothetical protein